MHHTFAKFSITLGFVHQPQELPYGSMHLYCIYSDLTGGSNRGTYLKAFVYTTYMHGPVNPKLQNLVETLRPLKEPFLIGTL